MERHKRLVAANKLALALGQSRELLAQIEAGQAHPVMAAFGLWADDGDFANLTQEIYANRERQSR